MTPKTFTEIRAGVLEQRMEAIADTLDQLLGELDHETPDVDQAIVEAGRIRAALKVRWLTADEAFRDATDGVCLLGEDHEAALLLGHIDHAEAARRAAAVCSDLCGMDLDDHLPDELHVKDWWVVFEDYGYDDHSDFDWWMHRTTDEGQSHAVPVTHVDLV